MDAQTQALSLRVQAQALLEQAQALDELKPFLVLHVHSGGGSPYILWASETPSQDDAEHILEEEFEPRYSETLVIAPLGTLEEMTGVALAVRLPDVLESLDGEGDDRERVPPSTPFAPSTSITVIDASTSIQQAYLWRAQLEEAYNSFFGDTEPVWVHGDTHPMDQAALVELNEIIDSTRYSRPRNMELITEFCDPDWRKAYATE